jgi:cytochrome c oxidase cbb3-type subunit III
MTEAAGRGRGAIRALAGAILGLGVALPVAGCDQIDRGRALPQPPGSIADARQPSLQAGPAIRDVRLSNPYDGVQAAIDEGERLYGWFNCGGCHGPYGGGGIGPPLAGGERNPARDFDYVYAGRGGGMPAFGGRIADRQIWMIVAYVQALGRGDVEVPDAPSGPAPAGIHTARGAP